MIISLRKMKEWTKFILLFVLFTLLLYQIMAFLAPYWRPDVMYKEPSGGAVKVFAYQDAPSERDPLSEIKNRLLIFYWLGE
ncbi:DUF4227 family protein [Paenactinomyces guangxiensis]|uniref:DUF4227 family protein n=1 Tax=Paenactinomyces guangxiensis TaxID=1490290 RepID=A0A7W1WTR8_9BACL|nr:DUF4227 family protein [Paenactinomyces guangxiensis]MBA4495701.1 DUF4227 family protein [Paenactinomyces guangxiensis]MBH8592689.1 DUF4227 family protein [Paenactinomyces guangxiensis]